MAKLDDTLVWLMTEGVVSIVSGGRNGNDRST